MIEIKLTKAQADIVEMALRIFIEQIMADQRESTYSGLLEERRRVAAEVLALLRPATGARS